MDDVRVGSAAATQETQQSVRRRIGLRVGFGSSCFRSAIELTVVCVVAASSDEETSRRTAACCELCYCSGRRVRELHPTYCV